MNGERTLLPAAFLTVGWLLLAFYALAPGEARALLGQGASPKLLALILPLGFIVMGLGSWAFARVRARPVHPAVWAVLAAYAALFAGVATRSA